MQWKDHTISLYFSMPTPNTARNALERSASPRDMGRRAQGKSPFFTRHLQRVYPVSMHKTCSPLSLSSLSLSQNSNVSSPNSSISSWERKLTVSIHGIFSSWKKREFSVADIVSDCREFKFLESGEEEDGDPLQDPQSLKRCNWITRNSDDIYVAFHDECWGVPVHDDNKLFELLALSGMLIDHNWTEILKRRELYSEAFAKFDHAQVAKMEEKDILETSSNKELMLAECRVRCIVENAICIQKVVEEFGSFSDYIWGHLIHKPMIGRHKNPKSVPLRTPKSEAISNDLLRRGFRLVGPVIVHSFMQASGMAIDHQLGCFRFRECVRLAERSWYLHNKDIVL